MYAVIQTGGKQYLVTKGERIQVERLASPSGEAIRFDQVLLIGGNGQTQVGRPYLSGVHVRGRILAQDRAKKIIVYKYKKRKGYDKKQGHRQWLTTVEITDIVNNGGEISGA
jgi:large subunit ribosomal protein L21